MQSIYQISRTDYNKLMNNAIKVWHLERCEKGKRGARPVEGKYDPDNPNHINPSEVIKINQNLKPGNSWNL